MKCNCKLIESAGRLTKVTKKNYEESQKTFGLQEGLKTFRVVVLAGQGRRMV